MLRLTAAITPSGRAFDVASSRMTTLARFQGFNCSIKRCPSVPQSKEMGAFATFHASQG